ncbi:MAG: hypothetical protein M3Y52_04885 [Actinomycetota bacterium]|nr:hypothetical protein [Actinomycetota bacterium]
MTLQNSPFARKFPGQQGNDFLKEVGYGHWFMPTAGMTQMIGAGMANKSARSDGAKKAPQSTLKDKRAAKREKAQENVFLKRKGA